MMTMFSGLPGFTLRCSWFRRGGVEMGAAESGRDEDRIPVAKLPVRRVRAAEQVEQVVIEPPHQAPYFIEKRGAFVMRYREEFAHHDVDASLPEHPVRTEQDFSFAPLRVH